MKRTLIALTGFTAVTSFICGLMMLRDPDGSTLHLSPALLQHTAFKNFSMPGYLLAVAVGGSSLLAALALVLREKKAWLIAMLAGIIINGWIVIEILLTRTVFWFQFLYLGAGMAIVLIAFNVYENKPAIKT